jgi:repressor LexA
MRRFLVKGLTQRQLEIVNFIRDFIATHEFSPSYREIMEHFGFTSLGSVYKHMNVLKRKGVILADKNSARSIALAEPAIKRNAAKCLDLPFLGIIAAGQPIETFAQAATVSVPAQFVPNGGTHYVLRVRGDSMRDMQIDDGDFVIVESRSTAEQGEVVVALIDGQATLKKIYFDGADVRLEPANSAYKPIVVDSSRVVVQGVLKALLRQFSA